MVIRKLVAPPATLCLWR